MFAKPGTCLVAVFGLLAGCSKSSSSPGISLERVDGAPITIGQLRVHPSKAELSGKSELDFPGPSLEHNGLDVRGQLHILEPVPSGHALWAKIVCNASSFAIVRAAERKVQAVKKQPFVTVDTLQRGDKGLFFVNSPTMVPELGAAKTCEVQFRYQPRGISFVADAPEAIDLGTVCAVSPTELRKGPCPENSLGRTVKSGNSVWVSPPVGHFTDDGALYWFMVTANQTMAPGTRVWTRYDCRGNQRHSSSVVHRDEALDVLAAGESVMISGFIARGAAQTRSCELHIGLHEQADDSLAEQHGATTASTEAPAMFTFCMANDQVREGTCDWPATEDDPEAGADAGPPPSP